MPHRSPYAITRLARAVSFALALAAAGATRAQVVYPGPHPCDGTLQACIDATPAGATVQIATNGPIAESISFEKSLTLAAADGFLPVFSAGSSIFASTPSSGSQFIRIEGLHLAGGTIAIGQNGTGSLGAEVVGCRATGGDTPAISIGANANGPPRGPIYFAIEDNEISVQGNGGYAYGIALRLGDHADATGTIRDNVVVANDFGFGGAIEVTNGDRVVEASIVRNRISGANYGAGIFLHQYGSGSITATVAGNEVSGQLGETGAAFGIWVNASGQSAQMSADVVNNTVVGNAQGILISGRADLGAVLTGSLVNDLVAGNHFGLQLDPSFAASFPNHHNLFFDNVSNFSDEEGAPFVPGTGTVFGDPLFAAPSDFSIQPGSAAQDAGDTSALPVAYNVDLAGNPRVAGAAVEIGAYEIPAPEPPATLAAAVAIAALVRLGRLRAPR